jgi:hypothetical protein
MSIAPTEKNSRFESYCNTAARAALKAAKTELDLLSDRTANRRVACYDTGRKSQTEKFRG